MASNKLFSNLTNLCKLSFYYLIKANIYFDIAKQYHQFSEKSYPSDFPLYGT